MKLTLKLLAITNAMFLPIAAIGQTAEPEFDVVDAMETCKMLFADRDDAVTSLQKDGWVSPGGHLSSDFKELNGVALQQGDKLVLFMGKGTDVRGEYEGACQMYLTGDSVVAATQIAVHLNAPASGFQPKAMGSMHQEVSNSVSFAFEDYMVRVASTNIGNTNMLFQYFPLKK